MIEDKDVYLMKTHDHIIEGDYTLTTKSEKSILRRLHRKLMDQLVSMGITDFKEQRMYTVTGPVMASMALLIKVHKKNFPGRAYVSQIDDPSYYICKELTRILLILWMKKENLFSRIHIISRIPLRIWRFGTQIGWGRWI